MAQAVESLIFSRSVNQIFEIIDKDDCCWGGCSVRIWFRNRRPRAAHHARLTLFEAKDQCDSNGCVGFAYQSKGCTDEGLLDVWFVHRWTLVEDHDGWISYRRMLYAHLSLKHLLMNSQKASLDNGLEGWVPTYAAHVLRPLPKLPRFGACVSAAAAPEVIAFILVVQGDCIYSCCAPQSGSW